LNIGVKEGEIRMAKKKIKAWSSPNAEALINKAHKMNESKNTTINRLIRAGFIYKDCHEKKRCRYWTTISGDDILKSLRKIGF